MSADRAGARDSRPAAGGASLLLCLLAALALVTVLVQTAWLCDDAYITLRTAANLIEGRGLTWNPGERVQAYTHPLWLFLVAGGHALTGEAFHSTLGLSLLLAILTAGWLAGRLAASATAACLGLVLWLSSEALVDYSSSGLATPLSLLLAAVFLDGRRRGRSLGGQCLVASLLLLTRLDHAVWLAPLLVAELWRASPGGRLRAVLLGALPLLLWEAFSLVYYGFPVPNTAYAKLGTAIPRAALVEQGLTYLRATALADPATLVVAGAGVVAAVLQRRFSLAAAVLLFTAYVVAIGGDFMRGRFLVMPAFLGLFVLVSRRLPRSAALLVGALAVTLSGVRGPLGDLHQPDGDGIGVAGITDERAFYYPHAGWLAPGTEAGPTHPAVQEARTLRSRGPTVVTRGNVGFFGYHAGPEITVLDPHGLTDPLLARLPSKDVTDWRIGHFARRIPLGYEETLESGENRIRDPEIAAAYDSLQLIVRGPLFGAARWRALGRWYRGDVRALLPARAVTEVSAPVLARPPVLDVAPDEAGAVELYIALDVVWPGPQKAAGIEVCAGANDRFHVEFFRGRERVAAAPLIRRPAPLTPFTTSRLAVPAPVGVAGFDRVRLIGIPRQDEQFLVQSLRLLEGEP